MAYRRKGYDFESLWYAGQAQLRQKKIMDCLTDAPELPGWRLKQLAGFGTGGEKNFNGTVTALQDMLYIVISDFRRRKNKFGLDYGWDVSVYARPEELWPGIADEAYRIPPKQAYDEIRGQMASLYPGAADQAVGSLIGTRM